MLPTVARNTNRSSYVVGEITAQEAELAMSDDRSFTRHGVYLMVVDHDNPSLPARVLAKFASEEAARNLVAFFRDNGFLEPYQIQS